MASPRPEPPEPPERAEPYEAFVRHFSQAEPALRVFVRSLLPSWEDADEVIQEASLLLWRKFDQFEPGTHFLRWACVVARFEALKYRRKKARDRHHFDDELIELLAEEATAECEQLEDERHALDHCIEKLDPRQRRLIEAAYGGGTSMKDVAAQTGCSATSLYKSINRIRLGLQACVERTLGEAIR